ncbi:MULTISPECIES: nuclease-related domain-containing protein [unclassified Psychrobacter]|uniref:nuclease-related domain-containing protein n=1 Tax=unclassified Psychrobacter TaxID=196806 RepID=UPI0017886299|nr:MULTISPECIES: nuclease-related domain-containing protein [unclassified Psychrobacter]MBE0442123.1 NERD domain-containing protein [Psychrobacter sp. FME13]
MAEMIPDSIGHAVDATAGERRVYNLLKSALLPDDEWIVWYEPCASIKSKHGDFLIFSIRHGMLLIEVKDWSASYIESASPSHFTIKNSNGTLQKRENPLKQARSVQLQIKNLLLRLTHEVQSHFGRWIKTLMLAHLGLFFTSHLVLHFMC